MKDINDVLTQGVEEAIVEKSLIEKLKSGKKLIVKLGIDPTGVALHLGHAVVLRKLKQFQDLGHQVILIIGDFTARIGDPSGKTKAREILNKEKVEKNMKYYKKQAGKILDLEKTKFVYNSQWFGKMGLEQIFELASKATFAQIFERKDFRQRIEEGDDISYLETLYPLMQGYDSVQLKADVELGGIDQKFNLLMGRQIQKRYKQPQQDIVIMKLLPGTDGAKMSKSADNYIGLSDQPFDMYGKIMSISDDLIPIYYELCTDLSKNKLSEIKRKCELKGNEVYQLKRELAKKIILLYHGSKEAEEAHSKFDKVYKQGDYKEASIETTIKPGTYIARKIPVLSGATASTVHAKRLIQEGAVELNNRKIQNPKEEIKLTEGTVIRIGKKRFIKVKK